MMLFMRDQKNKFIRDYDKGMNIAPICFAMLLVIAAALLFNVYLNRPLRATEKGARDCSLCHSAALVHKQKLTTYFKKKGSPQPEVMADAVLKTRNPRLLSAIAVRETGANPRVRNAGYRKRHSGAFQVSHRDWGRVSYSAAEQALQAEAILAELTSEKKSIVKALNQYGGDKTKRVYAYNILKELQEVPK